MDSLVLSQEQERCLSLTASMLMDVQYSTEPKSKYIIVQNVVVFVYINFSYDKTFTSDDLATKIL